MLVSLSVLLLLALPTVGGFRSEGDRQLCRANLGHLTRAWLLYAEDNGGRLTGNLDGGEVMTAANTNRTWAIGWLDNSVAQPANTNTLFLKNAQLGAYLASVSVFRCPADPSLSRGRVGEPRVRSVSMNGYIGQRSGPYTSGYRQFTTLSSIVAPSPSECYLMVEEREDSINDGWYIVDMTSFDPQRPSAYTLVDYPSGRHDGSGTFSFVDGHVENWVWKDPRTRPPVRPGQLLPLGQVTPNNPDVARLQNGASRRVTSIP